MKSATTIRRHVNGLRALINTSRDPVTCRIAYAMETALRWALLETHDWPAMSEEAKLNAEILRKVDMATHADPDGTAASVTSRVAPPGHRGSRTP